MKSKKVQGFPEKKKITEPRDYSNLKYGNHVNSKQKLSLKTFFGNPNIEFFSLRFDNSENVIAAGGSDGSISFYSLQQGKMIFNVQASISGQSPTTCIRFRPVNQGNQNLLISSNSDGSLFYWNATSGKQLTKIVEQDNQILSIDYSPDGNKFVTVGKNITVNVYDEQKGEIIKSYPKGDSAQPGHVNQVVSVKFIDQNTFITGGWDSNVFIWDVRESKSIDHIYGPNLCGDSLDYTKNMILTGSYRIQNQIQIYDFSTRKLMIDIPWIQEPTQNQTYIYASTFFKNQNYIIAGGCNVNSLKIFDLKGQIIGSVVDLYEGVYSIDSSKETNRFAFGGGDGIIYLCSLNQK